MIHPNAIAIGAIRAAYENHIAIPDTLGITGIDNTFLSEFLTPNLTTVDVPKADLCRLAVHMLSDQLENNCNKQIRLDVPFDLKIRESCSAKQ